MSLISLNRPAAANIDWAGNHTRPFAKALDHVAASTLGLVLATSARISRWWRNRQAAHMLSGADGAILRDLGIARGDIERVVRDGR
jgi:uncharacterized protein YjiS (DUF1127 family)